ncbi:MAG: hypothetical protein E7266_08415 [Lachnospiraceae bacterium]|nr:hypothetical protein [Lachnospiraceae bacterium]
MNNTDRALLLKVTELLHMLGLPAHIKGFYYIREAIIISTYKPQLLNSITKSLYPEIANSYHTSVASVERAIRHAIEVAWSRGNIEILTEYFGHSIAYHKGKPTNSEFISIIVDYLRINDFSYSRNEFINY